MYIILYIMSFNLGFIYRDFVLLKLPEKKKK